MLPQLAYHFSNGPWRLCYIKHGYDPRASFDSRIYQVIDLRLPPEFEKLVPKKCETPGRAPRRIRYARADQDGDAPTATAAARLVGRAAGARTPPRAARR